MKKFLKLLIVGGVVLATSAAQAAPKQLTNEDRDFVEKSVDGWLGQNLFDLTADFDQNKTHEKLQKFVGDVRARSVTQVKAAIVLSDYFEAKADFVTSQKFLDFVDKNQQFLHKLAPDQQARFYHVKGLVLGFQANVTHEQFVANLKEGLKNYDRVKGLINAKDDPQEMFRVHWNSARHYLWLSDKTNARKEIDAATALLGKVQNLGYKSAYFFTKGNIELNEKNYTEAKKSFLESQALVKAYYPNPVFDAYDSLNRLDQKLQIVDKLSQES